MASVFTRIIHGEQPGRVVGRDEQVVALLSIGPLAPGHTLVVPREEVDDRIDLDPAPAALDDDAERIRSALRDLGHGDRVG